METLQEYKQRIASSGGRAKWKNKTKEERSEMMKEIRKKGIEKSKNK